MKECKALEYRFLKRKQKRFAGYRFLVQDLRIQQARPSVPNIKRTAAKGNETTLSTALLLSMG